MSLKDRITSDMKTFMKSKEKEKLSVVRMLLSEIKYAQAAVSMGQELSDQEVLTVIDKFHKKLSKSLGDYPEGEQRSAIENEIKIVETYLPQKATREDVKSAIEQVLSESENENNFGILMKAVMAKLNNPDGKMVSEMLKEKLN